METGILARRATVMMQNMTVRYVSNQIMILHYKSIFDRFIVSYHRKVTILAFAS